ncbi:type II secretion system F family protein [Thiomicrospira sp. S5]|uniref:type II secretion system F family protein n=1 Tax=Thiomicrospira sp. S5 TaxID=1803865 RepID=UPI000F8A1A92|nr:type II secretion system F family protein [Thiomicrospira sp. S5]AZR81113.1 type II secretion system protein [Thiomicrospira sp. S5]
MSWGFVGVALVLMLPFILFVVAKQTERRQEHQQALNRLKFRVGFELATKEEQNLPWWQASDNGLWLWLKSQFKKAGLTDRKAFISLVALQFVLLFVSAFFLATQYSVLNEKTLFVLLLLPFLPGIYLLLKIRQRQKQLRSDFPEMLDNTVRALQSGYSIDGALASVAEDMKGPLADEFQEVNKQLQLGISMRDILREFQSRVALQEAQFFVITLIIQRETGGQLSAILTELSRLMRRREQFQAKLKTMTAESRFTAWFIGGAPVAYILYKYLFDPESMTFFLQDSLGIKLFILSLALIGTGTLILKQMLTMRF